MIGTRSHTECLSVLAALLLLTIAPVKVSAQDADTDVAPLFETHEPLALTLETDLRTLLNDRGDEREEHAATISYAADDGSLVTQDLKVEVRGNFRRNKLNCYFPPLRLNFVKKATVNTVFEGQDKIKLVTHCQESTKAYEQHVLLEYLSYRIYNQLTPLSFKVRLVEMTYADAEGSRKPKTHFGFLIEDDDALAHRIGGEVLDEEGHHQEATNYDQITLLALFQYMIGNTDWSVQALHNIRLIAIDGQQLPVAVPYDFDLVGLVDAPYAAPSPVVPIRSVRERIYRGFCRPEEALTPHIALFQEKKETIYTLFEDLEPLEKKYRKRALSYLDDFYRTIGSEKQIEYEFVKSCRKLG